MAVSPSALGELLSVFERNFRAHGEIGASVSVWSEGVEIISEGAGWCEGKRNRKWTTETLIPVYSATKVPSAVAVLASLEQKGLSAETPVSEVWPAFPVKGATFVHLLSHQCGLAVLDEPASMLDHQAVVAAIVRQQPQWKVGEGHGYHPRTFGALLDEPVRRLSGQTLGEFWRREIAGPMDLDFWIGLPSSQFSRVATLYPGKAVASAFKDGFYEQLATAGTMTQRAFSSPRGLKSIQEMNQVESWKAGFPALGGIGTASALAKFYQALLGRIASPLSLEIRRRIATPVSSAEDRILQRPTVFTCGAQMDPVDVSGHKLTEIFGPERSAFGHPGAGGSHGFCDPYSGISFAYVMNQMELSVMPGPKCMEMVKALYSDH